MRLKLPVTCCRLLKTSFLHLLLSLFPLFSSIPTSSPATAKGPLKSLSMVGQERTAPCHQFWLSRYVRRTGPTDVMWKYKHLTSSFQVIKFFLFRNQMNPNKSKEKENDRWISQATKDALRRGRKYLHVFTHFFACGHCWATTKFTDVGDSKSGTD